MVDLVVFGILNPDPERLRGRTVDLVVPPEVGRNTQLHSQHCTCDRLNGGIQYQTGDLMNTLLNVATHANVVNQMTWKKQQKYMYL